MNPRVGDPLQYRRDPSVTATVKGVNDFEVVVLLGGEPYGFSHRTFHALFEPAVVAAQVEYDYVMTRGRRFWTEGQS